MTREAARKNLRSVLLAFSAWVVCIPPFLIGNFDHDTNKISLIGSAVTYGLITAMGIFVTLRLLMAFAPELALFRQSVKVAFSPQASVTPPASSFAPVLSVSVLADTAVASESPLAAAVTLGPRQRPSGLAEKLAT
jgi:hypothetical protein